MIPLTSVQMLLGFYQNYKYLERVSTSFCHDKNIYPGDEPPPKSASSHRRLLRPQSLPFLQI